jgi:transposase
MASIIKKKVRGQTYYYAVQSQRVDGRPRIVWQKYLGKVEDILRKLEGQPLHQPVTAQVFEFGALAALWTVAQRLQVRECINAHMRKREQGVSVGEYLLLAALNRCVAPTSKRRLGVWFEGTCLRRLMLVKPQQLTSQRFWDHMDYVTTEDIRAIETDLTQRLVQEFQVDLRCLVYDTTNFVSFLDSATASELAQRGHSKVKRNNLKQIGLALLVSTDFHLPLFHEAYPGHRTDPVEFASVTEDLVARYQAIAQECLDVTLIFDKGNETKDNQAQIEQSPFHFIASLSLASHKDLLEVPLSDYEPLGGRLAGEWSYRTQRVVWGKERTVVLTFNPTLYAGQVQGLAQHLKKATQSLKDLQRNLIAWQEGRVKKGRPPQRSSVEAQVKRILGAQYIDQIITVEIGEAQGLPQLAFTVDQSALHRLAQRHFGKTLLFTDQETWSNEDIVGGYRGQIWVESAFQTMKDPYFVSWSPVFHWTDSKIRVHAFYCVLALTLTSLLWREVCQAGIELSLTEILRCLGGIYEVAHIYAPGSGQPDHLTLSTMDDQQRQLFDLLDLQRLQV